MREQQHPHTGFAALLSGVLPCYGAIDEGTSILRRDETVSGKLRVDVRDELQMFGHYTEVVPPTERAQLNDRHPTVERQIRLAGRKEAITSSLPEIRQPSISTLMGAMLIPGC